MDSSAAAAEARHALSLAEVVDLLQAKRAARGYTARCPAHDDEHPSLSIAEGKNGRLLLKCHAGCSYPSIVAAIEQRLPQTRTNGTTGRPEATYSYRDAEGIERYQVLRYLGKQFSQRRPDGKGGYVPDLKGCEPLLFHLPELQQADIEKEVHLCEGEEDVLAVERVGGVATTNSGGSKAWKESFNQHFRGRQVACWVDRDEAGAQRARVLRKGLTGVAKSLRFVQAKSGKDARDHLSAGHFLEEALEYLVPDDPTDALPGVVTLTELLASDTPEPSWAVEGLLLHGGLSALVAKPKVGKSTLVRHLIKCLVDGERFLGRETRQGPVLYFALEEHSSYLKQLFTKLAIDSESDVKIVFDESAYRDLDALRALILQTGAKVLVIDTMMRFLAIDDLNDYAKVNPLLAALQRVARETGCAILLVHHAKKGTQDDAGDATLGSTAVFGSVDVLIRLSNEGGARTIETVTRYGEAIEKTRLGFDGDAGVLWEAGSEKEHRAADLHERVLAFVGADVKTSDEIRGAIGSNIGAHLSTLVANGDLVREGTGKKGSQYRYHRPNGRQVEPERAPIPPPPALDLTPCVDVRI